MKSKKRIRNKAILYKIWKNMMDGKFFVKGEIDSNSEALVMASTGKYFGPKTCYYDYIVNLPNGTHYVDSE